MLANRNEETRYTVEPIQLVIYRTIGASTPLPRSLKISIGAPEILRRVEVHLDAFISN